MMSDSVFAVFMLAFGHFSVHLCTDKQEIWAMRFMLMFTGGCHSICRFVSLLCHILHKHHLFKLFGLQLVFLHFLSFIEKTLRNQLAQKKYCLFDHH